jgi:hypothetical protein
MNFIKILKMGSSISIKHCFIFFGFFFITATIHAQDSDSAALAAADTTNFSRNVNENWQLYNSYIAPQGTDSVMVQLILQHDNNINWSNEQNVGKIKDISLLPGAERPMPFSLGGINYQLRIDTAGECYLKVVSGDPPVDDPVVLPFTIIYNK